MRKAGAVLASCLSRTASDTANSGRAFSGTILRIKPSEGFCMNKGFTYWSNEMWYRTWRRRDWVFGVLRTDTLPVQCWIFLNFFNVSVFPRTRLFFIVRNIKAAL